MHDMADQIFGSSSVAVTRYVGEIFIFGLCSAGVRGDESKLVYRYIDTSWGCY